MKVAILIVNWNGFEDTRACLSSLAKHCKDADVLLLENGSGQEGILRGILDERTELFVSEKNLGFGGGCNVLIEKAIERGYDFVFLLNNDAEVTEGFLDEPLRLMGNPNVGFVASKLILKESGKIDSAGHWHLNSGDVIPAGRGRSASEFSRNRDILSGCAAALLLRTAMLKEIGTFDEDFFLGYEDVDLTYRATVMGWKGIYCASSVVVHRLGASIDRIRDADYYVQSQANSIRSYLYNSPATIIIVNTPWVFVKYLSVTLFGLFTWRLWMIAVWWRALFAVMRDRKGIGRKRSIRAKKLAVSFYSIWRLQRNLIPSYIRLIPEALKSKGV